MMESAAKTNRGKVFRYIAAYFALTVLSVAVGRQYALDHNLDGAHAVPAGVSLGSVELAAASGNAPARPEAAGNGQGAQQPFKMSGSVSNLKPGARTYLPVRIDNPNRQPLSIQRVTVNVANASPTCTADNLSVGSFDAAAPGALTYTVPANSTVTVPIRVELVDRAGNQDACKNQTFPLSFDGSAVQSGGAR